MPKPLLLGLLLIVVSAPTTAHCQQISAWTSLLDEETFLVVNLPVNTDAWSGLLREITPYSGPAVTKAVEAHLDLLHQQRVQDATLLMGIPDTRSDAGFVIAFSMNETPSPDAIKNIQAMFNSLDSMPNVSMKVQSLTVDNLILIGSGPSLNRYAALYARSKPTERSDLSVPLLAPTKTTQARLVLSPGVDVRRVIRELWPTPGMLGGWEQIWREDVGLNSLLDGDLLADGLRHIKLALSPGDDLSFELQIAARDEPTANRFLSPVTAAYDYLMQGFANEAPEFAELASSLQKAVRPQREGSNVVIRLEYKDPTIRKVFSEVLPATIAQAREAANNNLRMNSMKHLSLAMLNYEAVHGHYPSVAPFRDKQGKPLLSWRVALLPYLDKSNLYEQFHLDEPWDSPHNLTLLNSMPEVFANPGQAALTSEVKTTYLTPVGVKTLFLPAELTGIDQDADGKIVRGIGMPIRETTDGTSQTVMIVEVSPGRAVPWTKPADWEVEAADLLSALRQPTRKKFATAWADGHAKMVDISIEPQEFHKALTRGEGELLDYNKW